MCAYSALKLLFLCSSYYIQQDTKCITASYEHYNYTYLLAYLLPQDVCQSLRLPACEQERLVFEMS